MDRSDEFDVGRKWWLVKKTSEKSRITVLFVGFIEKVFKKVSEIKLVNDLNDVTGKWDIEKLTELLNVKKSLDDSKIESTVFQTKIENILKTMND